jgi:hypothetical protein
LWCVQNGNATAQDLAAGSGVKFAITSKHRRATTFPLPLLLLLLLTKIFENTAPLYLAQKLL